MAAGAKCNSLLNAHNVEALIVGGHARAFHGRPRYTKHLGIRRAVGTNAAALLQALHDFGFGT